MSDLKCGRKECLHTYFAKSVVLLNSLFTLKRSKVMKNKVIQRFYLHSLYLPLFIKIKAKSSKYKGKERHKDSNGH